VLRAIDGAIPVAYNAEYDRKVLVAELARAGLLPENPPPALRRNVEWIDPLIWARELQKTEKSRTLVEVAERLGVTLDKAHRAAEDAAATLEVLSVFRADSRVPKTYGAFVQEQRRLSRLFDGERQRWRRY
jgi:DNA polymerase-3 subunit epsilon